MLILIEILECFIGSTVMMLALNYLGARPWRRSRFLHWTERARLLQPVRVSAQLNVLCVAALTTVLSFSSEETRSFWPGFTLAGLAGAMLGCFPLDREIIPEFTFRTWAAQVSVGWGARILLLGPFIAAISLMPARWDAQVAGIALAFALWHLWMNTGGIVQVLRWGGVLKEAPEGVNSLLNGCFSKLNIRPRAMLILASPSPVAFAVPFRKELIFSRGLLEKLSPEEIQAICLHELAHLTEDRFTLLKRALVSFALYPLIFVRPAVFTWGVWGLAPIYAALFMILFLARRVGRGAEERADNIAAENEFAEGEYARALEKLYRLNQMPAVARGKRKLHPHLYDRMIASGVPPDFERPAPPAFANWTALVPIAALIALGECLRGLLR